MFGQDKHVNKVFLKYYVSLTTLDLFGHLEMQKYAVKICSSLNSCPAISVQHGKMCSTYCTCDGACYSLIIT